MIEDYIDNEILLKNYNKNIYMKEYTIKNRDIINKRANKLYHEKYKLSDVFKKKVSLQKANYYKNNQNKKIDEIFNEISNKFKIESNIIDNLKNEFIIKKIK
jgi:hypothetical protein